jgi:sugar phosphate isomerase/epimerase
MQLGAYTACLHDRSLDEALDILADLGLTSVEVNAGGFIATPHLPVAELLESESARTDYLAEFARRGLVLTGLNANGNPLHPDPEVGPQHAADLRRAIELVQFLTALHKVDPDIAVNIEHEDQSMGQVEGLAFAAEDLKKAAVAAGL